MAMLHVFMTCEMVFDDTKAGDDPRHWDWKDLLCLDGEGEWFEIDYMKIEPEEVSDGR